MNNDIKEQVLKIKKILLSDPKIKEFLNLKEEVKNNKEILEYQDKIRALQKKMTTNVMDKEKYEVAKKEYLETLDQYQNHPLVYNYIKLSEEIKDILLEIKEILE